MGADFISAGLWRRGESLQITDDEFRDAHQRVYELSPEVLKRRFPDRWADYESDDLETHVSDEVREDPERFATAIADALKNDLIGDLGFLKDALGGGRRDVGGMQVGPYIVFLMGEMSWGDVDEGMESIWRLADSKVLEPLGFQCSGYRTKHGDTGYGTVLSSIFEVIADRRDCKVEEVVAAADAVEIYEDRFWERFMGPAVDWLEDELHQHLPRVEGEDYSAMDANHE